MKASSRALHNTDGTVCPFLDVSTNGDGHVCLAQGKQAAIKAPYVNSFCLKMRHVTCRYFVKGEPALKRTGELRPLHAKGHAPVPPPMASQYPGEELRITQITGARHWYTDVSAAETLHLVPNPADVSSPPAATKRSFATRRATGEAITDRVQADGPKSSELHARGDSAPTVVLSTATPSAPDNAGTVSSTPAPAEVGPARVRAIPAPDRMRRAVEMTRAERPVRRVVRASPPTSHVPVETGDPSETLKLELAANSEPEPVVEVESRAAREAAHPGDVGGEDDRSLRRESRGVPEPDATRSSAAETIRIERAWSSSDAAATVLLPQIPLKVAASALELDQPAPTAAADGRTSVVDNKQVAVPVTRHRGRRARTLLLALGILIVVAIVVYLLLVASGRVSGSATPSTFTRTDTPAPSSVWHFVPITGPIDQELLTFSNPNTTAVRARITLPVQGGTNVQSVLIPAGSGTELDLDPQSYRRTILVQAGSPIIATRLVITHNIARSSYGTPGPVPTGTNR